MGGYKKIRQSYIHIHIHIHITQFLLGKKLIKFTVHTAFKLKRVSEN